MSLKAIATRHVVTVPPEATVLEVAGKMREYHVGDVVVARAEAGRQKPLGIITDRDIVLSTTAFGVAPNSVTAEEVMGPTLATARETDDILHVLDLMKEHGIKRVPLVDASGFLSGIVSAEDVVAFLSMELGVVSRSVARRRTVEVERRRSLAV